MSVSIVLSLVACANSFAVDVLSKEADGLRQNRQGFQEEIATLRKRLSDAESAERRMAEAVLLIEKKQNDLLLREDTILQRIETAGADRSFHRTTGATSTSGVAVEFESVPECSGLAQWDPASDAWMGDMFYSGTDIVEVAPGIPPGA